MINKKYKKGIILAGGSGTRLSPLTLGTSKQLLHIYNKPTIYYPLTTLMLGDIRDILVITNREEKDSFERLLGDGNQWGINIQYAFQENPNGIAEAFLIGEEFIANNSICLILGDNLFFGHELQAKLLRNASINNGATIFTQSVNDPERYGIVDFNQEYKAIHIEEKPKNPRSNYAITGLYFFDNEVVQESKNLTPSERGELEITDLIQKYLQKGKLNVEILGRGCGWFDTGTFDSLYEANSLIMTMEKRQGLRIGYPEEVAWRNSWIDNIKFEKEARRYLKNNYGKYLISLLRK